MKALYCYNKALFKFLDALFWLVENFLWGKVGESGANVLLLPKVLLEK